MPVSKTASLDPVGKLLVKRSKMNSMQKVASGSVSPVTEDLPSPNLEKAQAHSAGVLDCVELCRLLLEKVGADSSSVDSDELDRLLTTEYPPRVAELLVRITGTLDKDGLMDSLSDMTDSSDDEDSRSSGSFSESSIASSGFVEYSNETISTESIYSAGSEIVAKAEDRKPLDVVYKSETEIALSRIFRIGKTKSVRFPDILPDAPYEGPSVVTMTGFGELGRYGNQVLQYMFLKCYAAAHNIEEIQVPEWVGAPLFGLNDREVQRNFPPAVEFLGTVANSTFTDDLIKYVKGTRLEAVPELDATCLTSSTGIENVDALKNVDVWGWFQWHTSHFAPFKSLIQSTFCPVPDLDVHLSKIFNNEVRYRGGAEHTVVGIHLRYGDYQNIAASSFGYCAPTSWYINWLNEIWPTLKSPVLFVASDDLNAVLRDFATFDPMTSDLAGMTMPLSMQQVKAGFFPDWYGLTQCDIVAISNSTFSFTASMMNTRPNARFFRAHYALEMVEIDPWNTEPIVHRDMNEGALLNVINTLQLLYKTQGTKSVLRNVLYELPYYGVRSLIMKAVLWKQSMK